MEKITATSLLLLCLILASFNEGKMEIERERIDVQKIVTHYNAYFEQHSTDNDTIIPRSVQTIEYTDANGETIKVQIENGEVEGLRVDGEEVPKERYPEYEERLAELRSNVSQMPPPPPAPMAPHAFPMPPEPSPAPAPMVAPMPPLPAGAPLPPAPPAPPAIPDFGNFDYEIKVDPANFEFNFDDFELHQDMNVIVDVAPDAHSPHGDVTRSKSIIIREKNSDGSMSYRVEGDGSTIEIDEGAGVAIINGEDVLIDSDSIIVIEETETVHPSHNYTFFTPSPSPTHDVHWDAEKWAKEWKSGWNQEEWSKYWKENGKQWVEYSEQMEQSMKEYKESPEWKQYMTEVEEYRKQLKEQGNERMLFIDESGVKNEYIIRSTEDRDRVRDDRKEVYEYRVILKEEVQRQKEQEEKAKKEVKKDKGHSSVIERSVHRYVVATAPNNAEFVVSDGSITLPDAEDFENAGDVTIIAKVADVNSEGQLSLKGNVELKGDLANNPTPYKVILVSNEALTMEGKPLNVDELKADILEIKVSGPTPEATTPVAKIEKSKF